MRRSIACLAVLCVASAAPACRSHVTPERREAVRLGAAMDRTLRAFHVVHSSHQGKVGYMKVYDVVEAGGPAYPWKYVYDLDWTEVGFVDQFGNAYVYKPYAPFEQDIHHRTMRMVRLPSDSADRNVMRMLSIDPALDSVEFPPASQTDILGAPESAMPTPAAAPAAPDASGDASPN